MVTRTDGPFDYWEVTGDAVRAAADTPGSNAAVIQSLAGELEGDETRAADSIEGDIEAGVTANTAAARTTAQSLAAKGQYAVGLLKQFGADVDTFDTTVNQINVDYNTRYDSTIFGMHHMPEYRTGEETIDYAAVAASIQADLKGRYAQAEAAIDDAADTIASMFKQGPTDENVRDLIRAGLIPLASASLYPTLTLTTDDQASYYRSVMAGMGAERRAAYLLGHKEISAAVLDAILKTDRAAATEIGKEVAEMAAAIDLDSNEGDVKDVLDLLNRFKESGEASAAIVHEMGASGLISAISIAAGRTYASSDGAQTNLDLANAVRDVFRKGEPVLASYDEEGARDLAKGMVDFLKNPETNSDQPGNDKYALSFLLRDSTLSTPFLDTMGDELEHMERDSKNGGFTWSQFGGQQYGASWLFDEADIEAAFDPMASYMSALGHNDEASLQFFTGAGENPYGHDGGDRQEYWIERRLWSHDDFNGLMSALDSATTGEHTRSDPDARALVSNAFEYLANRNEGKTSSGDDLEFYGDGEKFKPGDLGGPGADHLAHIFGTYMAAVDYYTSDGSVADGGSDIASFRRDDLGAFTDMPVFNADDLDRILQTGLSNEDGYTAMREAVSNYQNLHMSTVVRDHHGDPDFKDVLAKAGTFDARLEALFIENMGENEIADGLKKDEQIKKWIDLGSSLAGEIPLGKIPGAGQAINFLASQGLDSYADSLKDDLATNQQTGIDDSNDAAALAANGRRNAIVGNLYEGGVISNQDFAAAATDLDVSKAQIDAWFSDGYPTQAEITKNQDLQNLIAAVSEEHFDYSKYQDSYQIAFHDYFEK